MPQWFHLLSKVLAMLAKLVPLVEEQFGGAVGSGPEKKAAVMERLTGYVRGPGAVAYPDVSEDQKGLLLAVAAEAVDSVVGSGKALGLLGRAPESAPDETLPPGEGHRMARRRERRA